MPSEKLLATPTSLLALLPAPPAGGLRQVVLLNAVSAGSLAGTLKLNKRYQEYSFPRLFVPWNIRSHDGTFVLGTIHSLEHSFPGPFVPWNFRSQDYLFPGTFVLWNFRSRYPGPFLPRTVRAFVSRAVPGLEQRNKQKRRPTTATVHSPCTQTVDRRYSATRLNQFSSSECG